MDPVIVMPDIEMWATGWIRAFLDDSTVYVSNSIPNPVRSKMIIVRDDGGPRVDMLHQDNLLVVNVYAPTEQAVGQLAKLVEGGLLSVRAQSPVEYVRSMAGPVRVSDVAPRRYFTVELTVRGEIHAPELPLAP